MGFATLLLLIAIDLRNYRDLLKDEPIAKVSFQQLGPQSFKAVVIIGESLDAREFILMGDQWQLDARVIRWSGLLQSIGGKPGYRLDRISGRYALLSDETQKPRSVHDLSVEPSVLDVWHWLYLTKDWLPGVDATYGSATFVPMADGALFQVGLGQTGLAAKPLNDAAINAVQTW